MFWRSKKALLFAASICLTYAAVIQSVFVPEKGMGISGGKLVPPELAGWEVRDLSLGGSTIADELVVTSLNCDSYVYREYKNALATVSVYSAYWAPGQSTIQGVATHSPEQCWVLNGWINTEWKDSYVIGAKGLGAYPGSWRRFVSPGGQEVFVVYWHIIEGRVANFGHRSAVFKYAFRWVWDGGAQLVRGLPEQYFVRISSTTDFRGLKDSVPFQRILEALEIAVNRQEKHHGD